MTTGRIPHHERSLRNKLFVNPVGFSETTKNIALSRGVPRQVLIHKPFCVTDHIATISAEVGTRIKTVNKQKQVASLSKMGKALTEHQPYVAGFASMPNDSWGSALAASLMMHAIEIESAKGVNRKSLPLWYTVTGDYKDRLKLDSHEKPSLLILSNIPENATPHKIEKVRDILEQFSDVPRIVVTTGCDPVTMFWTRLYYKLNYTAYLTEGGKSWTL